MIHVYYIISKFTDFYVINSLLIILFFLSEHDRFGAIVWTRFSVSVLTSICRYTPTEQVFSRYPNEADSSARASGKLQVTHLLEIADHLQTVVDDWFESQDGIQCVVIPAATVSKSKLFILC